MYFFNLLDLLVDQEQQFEDVKWTFYMIINHERLAKKNMEQLQRVTIII